MPAPIKNSKRTSQKMERAPIQFTVHAQGPNSAARSMGKHWAAEQGPSTESVSVAWNVASARGARLFWLGVCPNVARPFNR